VKSWLAEVFQLNPAGLNWPRGGLFLTVALVPLVLFWSIGHQEYLLSAEAGALFSLAADPGGSFGYRLSHLAVFALIGAGLTALAFGIGGDAWGWLVLAAFLVTLVAGLSVAYGARRFVWGSLLSIWFIIALGNAFTSHHHAHTPNYTWAQVLAWTGGAALWIVATFIAWLILGRKDTPARLPGDTSRQRLTAPMTMFAVIRALVIAATVAIAFGADLTHGYWMTIAVIVATKPSLEQTTVVGVQRIAGALMGAAAAILLLLIPANETGANLTSITHGLQTVALVFFMYAAALQLWNHAVFFGALTAAVLIDLDIRQPANYGAEGGRVLWTLCGVAIAWVVMLLAGLLGKRTGKASSHPSGPGTGVPAQRTTTADQPRPASSGT
jgi:hypothetical protein